MPKGTTKNKGRKDELDRFYTKPEVAVQLVAKIFATHPEWRKGKVFLEPSAGDGAFVYALEKMGVKSICAFDIAPADASICKTKIKQADYLTDDLTKMAPKLAKAKKDDVIVIGNPPFGEQATLAIAFVKKSLELGSICAFILPPSFCKESVQKKFAGFGAVVDVYDIDDTEYRVVGMEGRDVPSAFFVFDASRDFVPLPDHRKDLLFEFVTKGEREHADFAIRRVGGTAGSATDDVMGVSVESFYFCKKIEGCPDDIVDMINGCTFPERDSSVGPRTLSQKEIAKNVYEQFPKARKVTSPATKQ